jgi:hypothetical protein
MVHKGAPARELLAAIRAVAAGETRFPPRPPEAWKDANARLDPADRPLLDLVLEHLPRRDIVSRLGLSPAELDERTDRILARLSVPLPRATPGPGSLNLMPTRRARPAHDSVEPTRAPEPRRS